MVFDFGCLLLLVGVLQRFDVVACDLLLCILGHVVLVVCWICWLVCFGFTLSLDVVSFIV